MKKFLIVVCGPTAVGKSEVAIQLARHFHTEIISADARQFYIETTIGTAKPGAVQLATIKHHFINSLHIEENYNAGKFETDCIQLLDQLFLKHNFVVMCGGSGLYINAVINGIDDLPESDEALRKSLSEDFEKNGIESLQKKLSGLDPEYYQRIDINNPHRLIRAIEICATSGKPISQLRKNKKSERNFIPILIGLSIERSVLYEKINQRVDKMMSNGLLNECRELFEKRNLNSLQTVGYKELFNFIEGKISLDAAIELIKQNSRNYAKRQLTWFRKNQNIHWFDPNDSDTIINFINDLKKQNEFKRE